MSSAKPIDRSTGRDGFRCAQPILRKGTLADGHDGERRIPAPRQTVWEGLNDPEILKQCIPGCEEIEKLSDTEFTAKVGAKVGPVQANFTGKVTLSDLDPPAGYTITGEGTGGVAGFAKGGAKVSARGRRRRDGAALRACRRRSAASWRRSARA